MNTFAKFAAVVVATQAIQLNEFMDYNVKEYAKMGKVQDFVSTFNDLRLAYEVSEDAAQAELVEGLNTFLASLTASTGSSISAYTTLAESISGTVDAMEVDIRTAHPNEEAVVIAAQVGLNDGTDDEGHTDPEDENSASEKGSDLVRETSDSEDGPSDHDHPEDEE